MILKLGVKHQGDELFKVSVNHDLGMTMADYIQRSTLIAHAFEWKKISNVIKWGKFAGSMQMDRRFMFMEKNVLRGLSAWPLGYIHVYDHNIQTSSLKLLGQSKPNFMWSIVWKGE